MFITKYCLTKGILAVDAKTDRDKLRIELAYEKNCFADRADAVKKAHEMRNEKIAKLRQQISIMEEIDFEDKESDQIDFEMVKKIRYPGLSHTRKT